MTERRTKPFLASLSPQERAAFHAAGEDRYFGPGQTIFRQGDDDRGVLAIIRGRVKVSMEGAGGREVVVQFPGPGELVGELATIARAPRSATLTAVGDVEAIALHADEFRRFISAYPRVASLLFDQVAALVAVADRQRVDLATKDVIGRVAARLVELATQSAAEPHEDPVTISLALSQDELAAWTGASREAVAKALQNLRKLGLVQTGRREIIVTDLGALRNLGM